MCGIPCLSRYLKDGVIDAESKRDECNKVRINRNNDLIGMMEMLERDLDCLNHYNKVFVA